MRLAVTAEMNSNHPLAEAVRAGWREQPLPELPLSAVERPGLGIEARTGEGRILAGNRRFMLENGIDAPDPFATGTVIHVAERDNYAGYLIVADTVKPEAERSIKELRELGIERIYLLSGTLEASTAEVAEVLELDGAFGGLLPEEKVWLLEKKQGSGKGITVFAGDGMNDAPVIARADVGISMGRVASDVTVENADVVIMNDKVSGLPEVMRIAKKTKRVIWQNIALALGVKAGVLLLGLLVLRRSGRPCSPTLVSPCWRSSIHRGYTGSTRVPAHEEKTAALTAAVLGFWWRLGDSNPRPLACHASALPLS